MTTEETPKHVFARLFVVDGQQVLVMLDANSDDKPSVCISTQAALGVGAMHLSFGDDDKGHDMRDKAFDVFTQEQAEYCARQLWKLGGGQPE